MITTVSAPRPPQLGHAPPPPLVQRARFRRWLALAGVALAILSALWWAPPLWRNARAVYWQRRCVAYTAPPEHIVLDVVEDGPFDAETVPAWREFYPFIAHAPARQFGQPVLFLHGRRPRAGGEQLVAVELASGNFRRGEVEFTTWTPTAAGLTRRPEVGMGGDRIRVPGLKGAKHLRFFAGQPDRADASRFTIAFEVDGRKGVIEGTFEESGAVELRVRAAETTAP
jgi:hypothetical protein